MQLIQQIVMVTWSYIFCQWTYNLSIYKR